MPKGIYKRTINKGWYQTGHKQSNTGKTHFKKGEHKSVNTEFKKGHKQIGGFIKGHKLSSTGKNHHLWKGGVTSENENIRRSIKFKEWRLKVYKRDNWICQKCNSKKKIIPHHIFNFAQFINFRFELFNGITFCEKCHLEFHKIYGYSNNNREQIKEFIV